ncbi:helix-turn-helix domain-containing protein [Gracilibacillus dipsosauri]|uniref:helix-turn-helix domain-containing protein n=1 Tax=Gracilibacillus dipsosauri TaxID=178340 RepID=UPI00240A3AE7
MKYGERLKKLRNKKGFSQKELTDRLNLNRSTYARYELCQTQPDFDTLDKLANFYDVTVDYLLGRSNDPRLTEKEDKEIDKQTRELLDMLDELPPDRKDHYMEEIKAYVRIRTHADNRGKD